MKEIRGKEIQWNQALDAFDKLAESLRWRVSQVNKVAAESANDMFADE